VGKTSGTTGTPLDIFRSYDSTLWEQAFCRQHWAWAGWRPGETQLVLRGDLVVPVERGRPPFWFHDRAGGQLIVSTRHLQPAYIGAIAEAIAAHAPTQMRAYPSAAYRLVALLREAGLQLPPTLRSVITGSELLMPVQREAIESVLGAKVFDHYGMAERVAFGMECEQGRLHVNPEYSVVELLDADGQPADGVGFVVGTTLRNLAMPLLRYRLTDMARWSAGPCPCGRSYPSFESVGGRIDDQLYDLDGEPVSPAVVTFAFKGVPLIAKAQVAQTAPQRWVVRVVPMPGFGTAQEALLLHNFRTLVSRRISVSVQQVEDIPLLASGKYKWVTQECPLPPRRPAVQPAAPETQSLPETSA
jgi:phenylacetate-CoA ligase